MYPPKSRGSGPRHGPAELVDGRRVLYGPIHNNSTTHTYLYIYIYIYM